MIKAIAFDLGGVLFTEGKSVAAETLFTRFGYDKQAILGILDSRKSLELRKGLLSDKEFWEWVRKNVPSGYDADAIKKIWYDSYQVDEDILQIVKSLRGRYMIAAFSSNIKSRVEYLDKKFGYRKMFDVEVYSYQHSLGKQEREMVSVLVRRLGVRPEEMVFIDDQEANAAVARSCGVKAAVYSAGNIGKLKEDLAKLGVSFVGSDGSPNP